MPAPRSRWRKKRDDLRRTRSTSFPSFSSGSMASQPQAAATSGYALVRHGCGMLPQAGIPCSWRAREPTAERAMPPSLSFIFGGRRGIRTPGGFHLNGFQDRRDRPLRHPSVSTASKGSRFLLSEGAFPPFLRRHPVFRARTSAAPFQSPLPSAVLNGVRRGRRAPKYPRPSACR